MDALQVDELALGRLGDADVDRGGDAAPERPDEGLVGGVLARQDQVEGAAQVQFNFSCSSAYFYTRVL